MRNKLFSIFIFLSAFSFAQSTYCFTVPNITLPTYTPSPIPTITYTVLANTTYSTTSTEQTYSLTMSSGGTPYLFFVAYSLKLPDTVKANSIIAITSRGEVTNNYSYACGVVSYVTIGKSATDTNFANLIVPPAGADILDNGTNGHNHIVFATPVQYLVPSKLVKKYINVCVYAYSSSANTGDYCTLNQGYGYLNFTIFSP